MPRRPRAVSPLLSFFFRSAAPPCSPSLTACRPSPPRCWPPLACPVLPLPHGLPPLSSPPLSTPGERREPAAEAPAADRGHHQLHPPFSSFVPGLPHVTLVELRRARDSYVPGLTHAVAHSRRPCSACRRARRESSASRAPAWGAATSICRRRPRRSSSRMSWACTCTSRATWPVQPQHPFRVSTRILG